MESPMNLVPPGTNLLTDPLTAHERGRPTPRVYPVRMGTIQLDPLSHGAACPAALCVSGGRRDVPAVEGYRLSEGVSAWLRELGHQELDANLKSRSCKGKESCVVRPREPADRADSRLRYWLWLHAASSRLFAARLSVSETSGKVVSERLFHRAMFPPTASLTAWYAAS